MIAGGLVWATNHSAGTLYGLDPTSGAMRSQFPIPENGSNVNHFASPSAGGGRPLELNWPWLSLARWSLRRGKPAGLFRREVGREQCAGGVVGLRV